MHCHFKKYILHFKKPGGTSRGVLHDKETYFLFAEKNGRIAIGECNRFTRLSYDDRPGYEEKLQEVCRQLENHEENILPELSEWPSIQFGVETLLKDLKNGCNQIIYPEAFLRKQFSVPINGLIWMGKREEMYRQIVQKLEEGFTSVKLKIGAIDFEAELELIRFIRRQFSQKEVEIRLDANGAFQFEEAKEKLNTLSVLDISYIEQPIRAGQWQEMAALCESSPIKIALDEELIGKIHREDKEKMIATVLPKFLILKPALIGGFNGSDEWKALIKKYQGDWIITSALESNIGLNAIAQYSAKDAPTAAQGLGTGQLFTNNIPSPYSVNADGLHYHSNKNWDFSALL